MSFVLGKVYENNPKFMKKVLFNEIYFEEITINWKPIICSQNKIITKFGLKNGWVLFWANCTKSAPKFKKKCYFSKLILKRVISIGNPFCAPKIRYWQILNKKWLCLALGKVYENCPKIKKKCYFTKLTSKRAVSIENPLFTPKIR